MKKSNFSMNLFVFAIGLLITINANGQSIISLDIEPPNPTNTDEIILYSENLFGSGPCFIDSSFIAISGCDIKCDGYFFTGMLTVMCTSIDTFYIGQLNDGTYQLHYNLYHPSSNPTIKDSTTITFTVGTVGMNDPLAGNTNIIYPNPSGGELFLDLSDYCDEKEFVLSVYSLYGKEVKTFKQLHPKSYVRIDISDLSPGIYYYECYFPRSKDIVKGKVVVGKF